MPGSRLVFALTLIILALLPAAAVAQGPADVYRAWWTSGLTPADSGAERFRSQASLAKLAALRSEDPEYAAESIAFMTDMHRALVAAAVPGHIEIVNEDAEHAVLHVTLRSRDESLPGGMPSEITVRMVNEEDDWKVDTESFSGGTVSGGSEESGEWDEACVIEGVLGDTASVGHVVVRGAEGDLTVALGAAYLLRDGNGLTLHLPPIGENLLTLEARTAASGPGIHRAVLGGTRFSGGCPALPDALVFEDAPTGELEWQLLDDPASARVSFDFPDPELGVLLLAGNLDVVPLIDISTEPMGPGSVMVTFDGEEIVPDAGRALFYQGEARLDIMMQYVRSNGGGSTSLSVPDFRGEPGVYPGPAWFDTREVTVVRVVDGNRIELEVREIATDEFPDGEVDASVLLEMGILKARVVTDRMVMVPPLVPTDG